MRSYWHRINNKALLRVVNVTLYIYGYRAIPTGTAAFIIGVAAAGWLEEHRYPQQGLYLTGCSLCPHYCLNGGRASCSPRHSQSPVADRIISRGGNFCEVISAATLTGIAWSSSCEPVTGSARLKWYDKGRASATVSSITTTHLIPARQRCWLDSTHE